jgi:S1-C subfamily serine protease
VNSRLAVRNGLRSNTGIYAFATAAGNEESGTGLAPGDVIASVNGKPIISMQELRAAIHELSCRSSGHRHRARIELENAKLNRPTQALSRQGRGFGAPKFGW